MPGVDQTEDQLAGPLMTLQPNEMHVPSTRLARPRIAVEHMKNNDRYRGNKGLK